MERYLKESDVYALFPQEGIARLHVSDIDKLPRADVTAVIHARWVSDPFIYLDDDGKPIKKVICSRCGTTWVSPGGKYCNCGAKMDLESGEPYKEPMTQLARLQNMSADELAEFLSTILENCYNAGYHGNGPWDENGGTYCSEVLKCPLKDVCKTVLKDQGGKGNAICDSYTIKEWLNQIVEVPQEEKTDDEVHFDT